MLNPRDGIGRIWYRLIKWAPQTHPKMTIFSVQVATANLSRDSEWQGLAGFSAKNDSDILGMEIWSLGLSRKGGCIPNLWPRKRWENYERQICFAKRTYIYIHIYIFVGQVFECWFFSQLRIGGGFPNLDWHYNRATSMENRGFGEANSYDLATFHDILHCLKVLRPYFLSPCRKWHKKRIHSRFLTILEPLYVPFRLLGPVP